MQHTSPTPDPRGRNPWVYSETVDEARSVIRVRGRVDGLGVDLLRGTVEQLSRRGHRHITVSIEHPDDVDACARAVLAEVAEDLARVDGRLTIQWSAPADDTDPDLVAVSSRHHPTGRTPHRARGARRHRPALG
jgi:hypothetical protein